MFIIKCLLFLFVLGQIDAQYGNQNSRMCPYPHFEHGRFRMRQKSKLIKFICFPGYELVGNKYATCRNGEWDVPLPICVKPGCQLPPIENGIQMPSLGGAWVIFFCMPGHKLVGSSAIYCNGRRWNDTAPTCVDTTAPSKLSCDFEEANNCGWKQDELHDFDWKRLNRKTPSSYFFTGPSFDHTFGEGGSGYYMYIESTSRLENDTARLVSPIYDQNLAQKGCFSFFYHMFGKTTGGLRVYQKPEKYPMQTMMSLSESDRKKYLLFEKWGNQGDAWYSAAPTLKDFSDSFQIVIEGIRGSSYTSDIAIDDVAILQGENCTIAQKYATTPVPVLTDSCAGRCDLLGTPNKELGCGCTAACMSESDCCPDFFDVCIFDSSTSPDDMPQTQKLVASTTSAPETTSSTTTTTPKPKMTTTSTTTKKPPPPPPKPTTKATTKIVTTPKKLPTVVLKTTTPVYRANVTTTKIVTKKPIIVTTAPLKTTKKVEFTTKTAQFKPSILDDKMKAQKEKTVEAKKVVSGEIKSESSGVKTTVLTITALMFCVGAVWLVFLARGERGKVALARLRGRTQRDPEVRYLNADVDDD